MEGFIGIMRYNVGQSNVGDSLERNHLIAFLNEVKTQAGNLNAASGET